MLVSIVAFITLESKFALVNKSQLPTLCLIIINLKSAQARANFDYNVYLPRVQPLFSSKLSFQLLHLPFYTSLFFKGTLRRLALAPPPPPQLEGWAELQAMLDISVVTITYK